MYLCIHQIVAFFMENKTAIKINNLIVAYWFNIFCKCGGVKWRNCYQCDVNVTHSCSCLRALSYTGVFRHGKLASE